jgi:hypothetical protein
VNKPEPPRVQIAEAARRTVPVLAAPVGTIVVINEVPVDG